jgi:hypothetical protein
VARVVWTRTHTIVAAAASVVAVGGGIGLATVVGAGPPAPQPVSSSGVTGGASRSTAAEPAPDPRTTQTADPLTGGRVSDQEVIAVKVENIAAARPQVGLNAADIIFATEVEGAQTRLIAIYHTSFPTRLGPVRSARSTDVQLLPMFGKPGLVYSGANSRVQRKIDRASIVPIYRETRDRRRVAPHNVFVNLSAIARSEKAGRAEPIGWTFAARDDRVDQAKEAPSVKSRVGNDRFGFAYAGGTYTVRWNGRTYADGDTGTTLKVDNVVVLGVHNHPDGNTDVLGSASVQSDTVGKGKVTLYRDGRKLTGTWSRESETGPMTFAMEPGEPLNLKPGSTWVSLQG